MKHLFLLVRKSHIHTEKKIRKQEEPFFPLFIEFIDVTLVKKIIQVSDTQFYNTSSVHLFIVHPPPQVKSPTITIYSPYILFYLPPTQTPEVTTLLSMFMEFFSLFCSIPPHLPFTPPQHTHTHLSACS